MRELDEKEDAQGTEEWLTQLCSLLIEVNKKSIALLSLQAQLPHQSCFAEEYLQTLFSGHSQKLLPNRRVTTNGLSIRITKGEINIYFYSTHGQMESRGSLAIVNNMLFNSKILSLWNAMKNVTSSRSKNRSI